VKIPICWATLNPNPLESIKSKAMAQELYKTLIK